MSRIMAIDGKPVMDAKRSLKLIITKNDCARASIKEPQDCAAARAIRRELHAKECRVHLGRVYVRTNESNWQRYVTPDALRSEIIAFDRGGAFSPGEYVLAPLPPSKRTGKQYGADKKPAKKKRGGKKRRRTPHFVRDVRTGPAT